MEKPGASAVRFGMMSSRVGTILSIKVIGWPVPIKTALTIGANTSAW